MKVSKYIIEFFESKGIKTFFVFQGGAIMNLIHEIGESRKSNYIIPHHEQSLSMQVDTFARLNGYGVGMVTSGPGATNILTGVCSAYYDSVPCFFITGQVGQIHLKKNDKYRQFGFQETDVISIFKSTTKYAKQIQNPEEIKYELEKAYYLSKSGRPGPVLIDIPFNIQVSNINPHKLRTFFSKELKIKSDITNKINKISKFLTKSKKPVFLIGGGIKNSTKTSYLFNALSKKNLPFVTTWTSQDITSTKQKNYFGSIGKNGHRTANFACQEADLIISLGQRFAVKNIFGDFGKKAKIIAIDVDKEELKSNLINIDFGINTSIDNFIKKIKINVNKNRLGEWLNQLTNLKKKSFFIDVRRKNLKENKINPFEFFQKISRYIDHNHILHVDIGAHQTWFFQSFIVKKGQKIVNHCGHGAMGHAICSGIAGFYSKHKNKKNIVFLGDGGFMMNVQELNFISKNKLPIKIVVLNNSSLGNTFLGTLDRFKKTYGNDEVSGYSVPNIKKIAKGFQIDYIKISSNNTIVEKCKKFLNKKGNGILEVEISKFQPTAELHQISSFSKDVSIE